MKTIDEQIREKKAEIKEANRALSKLQDDLKKNNEAQWYKVQPVSAIEYPTNRAANIIIYSNRPVDTNKIKSAIESLSETSEPKSYVDWNKIPSICNWAAIDEDGIISAFVTEPYLCKSISGRSVWTSGARYLVVNNYKTDNSCLPAWDKSLIRRPGVKK